MGHFNELYIDNCDKRTSDDDLHDRREGISAPPPLLTIAPTTCQYCQRSIVAEGKSIHYCIERKKVGRKTISIRREYVAHFDGRYMGDYPHYLAAETALDEYVYDLCEQGLIDTLPTLV